MGLLEGVEGVHVGALTVEVDGQDGFYVISCGCGEYCFNGAGREVEGARVNIGEDGAGSSAEDGADGGEEAEGGGDDDVRRVGGGGVEGADVGGGEGQPECVGAAGASYSVRDLTGYGCCCLKGRDLRAKDELLRGADGFDGSENFCADFLVLTGEVQHGNCWGGGLRMAV